MPEQEHAPQQERPQHTGKALGLPYDWRKPTAGRYRSRYWNPDERRIFPPKAFGWGLGLNFYEVLRRLRIVGR